MTHHQWHAMESGASLEALGTDSQQGLGKDAAAARLTEHGRNTLPADTKKSWWRVFGGQFTSPLIHVLLVAAAIAFSVGKHDDAVVILIVVLVNALIGAIQEGRAERSMESLRKLSTQHVRVVRDGSEVLIEAGELVPGDIVLLAAGDAVAADARLLDAAALEIAEAALTGESLPVMKNPAPLPAASALADRRNMVYSGTHVAAGRARAVVVSTGTHTEVGRIARLTSKAQEPRTPLEQRLAQFGRWLLVASIVLFFIVGGLGLLRGMPAVDILMVAISQMVSLVPEGLPVAMTIALAVGMQRMARRGAIVRRLAAVETLGSTTIICTDKTGTLTRNEMTVTSLWLVDGRTLEVAGAGYSPEGSITGSSPGDSALRALLEVAALCNDAQLVPPDNSDTRWRPLGDPTEAALLTLAMKGCVDLETLRRDSPRQTEIPFDSASKMMATMHGRALHGRICIKGAPEEVFALSSGAKDGELRASVDAVTRDFASRALRVIALAEIADSPLDPAQGFEQFKGKAVLLGIVGEMDPPRDEVRSAVTECRDAGIRPVMVTGDHKATGLAVARQLGIASEGDSAVDGAELEDMPEQELRDRLDGISVFARVHPAQKLRIVEAFQSRGHVVAMTGDGVNDAPALAQADVGVAMGITGTDVAKGAAKIVITDDNFATIVRAVEQGRLVFRNLQKVLLFLFATSVDEIILLLGSLLLGFPLPLTAVQILWINLVTEGVITVNLIMEGPEGDEMKRKPTSTSSRLFTPLMLKRLMLMGCTSSALALGFFAWRLSSGDPFPMVQTETFTLVAVCQWFNVVNCRSEFTSAFTRALFTNVWLIGGLILGNILQFAVVYTESFARIFHTVPISTGHFFLIGGVASVVLWVEEIRKYFARRKARAGFSK